VRDPQREAGERRHGRRNAAGRRHVLKANVYSGTRQADGATVVNVNGRPLDTRIGFREGSATTFDWGYEGRGGPAQLALAILADHLADDEMARRHYEQFLRSVIRHLPSGSWVLTGPDIDAVLPVGDSRTV
jgi:hypothetical protein